jgi:simple sugar transport system ATP-binding protein
MVHQHFTLVSTMTVTENIALGGHGLYHPDRTRDAITRLAERTGLAINPRARIDELPAGAQQRVEILKALSHDTRVLILDEPTAVLTPGEAAELLRMVRALVNDGGTVILITHKLRDALEFADDITVMRHGSTIWTGLAIDATENTLVAAMLGTERPLATDDGRAHVGANSGETVLSLKEVCVRDATGVDRLKSVTLTVRRGEIVGVAAVEGNGQRELLRVLAGRMVPTSGEVIIPATVGFIPEDRQRDALIQDFSLRDNVALLGAGTRKGLINWGTANDQTRELLRDYHVRPHDEDLRASALSGGNQQKLVVGREIEGSHVALVAENPSRGLDVQAAAAVRARIRAARDAGMAVVVYSSDMDEVLALADRVINMYAGYVREVASEYEAMGRAMLGLSSS